ncbi:hypothetical protein FA13DRAFT_1730093 [Coprinellus micaceus]|uniref:Secreted protein n=1 Tax=Coprinellus micaceus TaxID=71717 RepID=A0A4Y7THZ8_COPMI|nr:hypothetical protein FA13DRAFT_1747795 [Coprinellus micaceus]TEB33810.1 hypothetical protein FA13DRAFT_1730093 [Coprinellus micaceus]
MLYTHLAVLYSLLIAGTVSVAKHALTKADSMFVIICVASPQRFTCGTSPFGRSGMPVSSPLCTQTRYCCNFE